MDVASSRLVLIDEQTVGSLPFIDRTLVAEKSS